MSTFIKIGGGMVIGGAVVYFALGWYFYKNWPG